MRFLIKHEVQGRLRIHVIRNRMTCTEADVLCWALEKQKSVIKVKVYERTADAVIYYTGDREELIHKLKKFHFEKADVPDIIKFRACFKFRIQGKADSKNIAPLWREIALAKFGEKNMAYF